MPSLNGKTPRRRSKFEISPSPTKPANKQHKIHNEQKLKVFIKFKPQNENIIKPKNICVSYLNEKQLEIQTSINKKIYTFDHVFEPQMDPSILFNIGCSKMIEQVIEGVHDDKINNNGLVFVYGNTGTGKTHTMGLIDQINHMSRGLAPDALRHIFQENGTVEEVCISFCEIYKDEVYDLLDFAEQKKLAIRQNHQSKEPYIEDLIMIQVKNFTQASQLLNIGLQKRKIAEQKVNNRSSRGHGIITFYLRNRKSTRTGRICFVDLAGCQRIKQSESKGATLNQALFINTSLSALQTLLMNISDQNVRSYRSNKLTRLLQPYFQFGKIRLFVTSNYQSIQSIQFAKRCKGIKFHERQVRNEAQKPFRTPQKSIVKENQKIKDKIQNLKNQFISREKEYLKCITNLVSLVQKIYQKISSSVAKQSIHSSFSLPQLFQHLPLESKVNAKINIFQKKQEEILQQDFDHSFSKISSQISTEISLLNEDSGSIFQRAQQIIKSSQQVGFLGIQKIDLLSQLAEYKNVYKKEWFTSQIKNGLLENKNDQFEKGIVYLMDQFNKFIGQVSGGSQIQGKIYKKLKQFGIILSEDKSDKSGKKDQTFRKTSTQGKISTQKMKTTRKQSLRNKNEQEILIQSNENIQHAINKSRKRSIIYIDQE